jgi:hypothetical protein
VQRVSLWSKVTTGDSTDSTCTFSDMDNNNYDMACASDNTPGTTCSTKISPKSATHMYGAWSPDRHGSIYTGSGDVSSESSWTIPSGRTYSSIEVTFGSSGTNTKMASGSYPVSTGFSLICGTSSSPNNSIDQNNWIGTAAYPDIFTTSWSNDRMSVTRTDTGGGWGMDLKVMCYFVDPVGSRPDHPHLPPFTCKDGSTNTGWYRISNKYDLDLKCPDGLYTMTTTVTTAGSTAGAATFEAEVDSTYARANGGQIKVTKQTTRRLGDERRLRSLEESTDGWSVKYEHTAEAPADSGSASGAPSGADATGSKTGATAAVAVGASALVIGAVALAALFAGRQQKEQGCELELSVALATMDESAEL